MFNSFTRSLHPRSHLSKLLTLLSKETHNPLWSLIHQTRLTRPRPLPLTNISHAEYTHWRSTTVDPRFDLESALQSLPQSQSQSPDQTVTPSVPPWVLFHLIIYKVHSPSHASGLMMDLVSSYLPTLPTALQPPFLIFCAFHLSRFNLLQPLTHIINIFLLTPLPSHSHSSLYFNLLLHTLSLNPHRSTPSAHLIVRILKSMDARQLKLDPDTYNSLLNDRFVTVELTKQLWTRMRYEGLVPSVHQLERFLTVFAKGGAVEETKRYVKAIRGYEVKAKGEKSGEEEGKDVNKESHMMALALSGFKDRASAFDFLKNLTEPSTTLTNNRTKRLAIPAPRLLTNPTHAYAHAHAYTSLLTISSRDPQISTHHLLRLFRRLFQPYHHHHHQHRKRPSSARPTLVSYTVLIRGLLYRNAVKVAERIWNEMINARFALDGPALTVGVETLTMVGKPNEALELLEQVLASGVGKCSTGRTTTVMRIDIHTLNAFMESLLKIHRPDVVFKLWNHMPHLYGASPSGETLVLLLKAARVACLLDDTTFRGAVAHLSLKLRRPFGSSGSSNLTPDSDSERELGSAETGITSTATTHTRDGKVKDLILLLGDKKTGLKHYKSGIWNDATPIDGVSKVFTQVVFGYAYDRVADVAPPAYALRTSINDTDPSPLRIGLDLGLGLSSRLRRSKTTTTPALPFPSHVLRTQYNTSWYPHIIPTNDHFLQYLLLLGLNDRAGDIPTVLAWMRAAEVTPDRATLAVALVFWAEVGMGLPLFEAVEEWRRGRGRAEEGSEGSGQFEKLVVWMKEWVGEENMPRPENLRRWQFWVKRVREGEILL